MQKEKVVKEKKPTLTLYTDARLIADAEKVKLSSLPMYTFVNAALAFFLKQEDGVKIQAQLDYIRDRK
jgi:hypothetical protein